MEMRTSDHGHRHATLAARTVCSRRQKSTILSAHVHNAALPDTPSVASSHTKGNVVGDGVGNRNYPAERRRRHYAPGEWMERLFTSCRPRTGTIQHYGAAAADSTRAVLARCGLTHVPTLSPNNEQRDIHQHRTRRRVTKFRWRNSMPPLGVGRSATRAVGHIDGGISSSVMQFQGGPAAAGLFDPA